jgi:NADH-ubiquinone oxidoreductase chain 6
MLIDIRTSELQSNNSNSIPLALFVSIFLNYALFQILPYYLSILNTSANKLSLILYSTSIVKYNEILQSIGKYIPNLKVMFVTSNN